MSNAERPIIAISHEDDAHLPFVERHLDRPMLVIDPTRIMDTTDNELSYEFVGGRDRLIYKDEDVSDAISVWYRKPKPVDRKELETDIDERYVDYSFSALQKHIAQLHGQLPKSLWVSDFYAIQRANNKTLQYKLAHELGMRVPDTLMTSNSDAAKEFLDHYPTTIIKSLSMNSALSEDGDPLTFFARKVARGEPVDLRGLNMAPAVFQEAIDAEVDIRVTVVGDKAFPATIVASDIESPGVRDWRAGHFEGSLSIEACDDLPEFIQQACIDHVRGLGLRYGAIDLVVDKQKEIWFLENNPNGQWAFVEEYTGQPIGAELAKLLSSSNAPYGQEVNSLV